MDEGERKVTQKNDTLVMCDYGNCSTHGEYTRCYFDIYKDCRDYKSYMVRLVHGDLGDGSDLDDY